MKAEGYSQKELFILAFDHRTSFTKNLLNVTERSLTLEEKNQIGEYKNDIFEGFKKAVKQGVPKEAAGILVDEEFGADVARKTKAEGYILAMPVEKSGLDEFDFEYGRSFNDHIERFDPDYVKVLVRYNPEDDREINKRQIQRLKILSDYLHKTCRSLLFELLVPPTTRQMVKLGSSLQSYDSKIRSQLMVAAIRELQQAGIEPSIWKLEGVQKERDAQALVKQVREDERQAGVITLGRGESKERVQKWVKTGARTPGIIGFALGRTIFWEPLIELKKGKIDCDTAINRIANNYLEFVNLWRNEREHFVKS